MSPRDAAHPSIGIVVGVGRAHDQSPAGVSLGSAHRSFGLLDGQGMFLYTGKPCMPVIETLFMRKEAGHVLGLQDETIFQAP